MKIKLIFLCLIILTLGLFIAGCNLERAMPVVISLEESIKEIINSKGEDYNFLSDELYNKKMEELIQAILSKLKSYKIVYKLGNLDEDSIPELAVFVERNPEDIKDQGLLQIYKFNGERYEIIDEIPMNYDNNNYGMEIGKISENQQGLLFNNQVGAHSGMTYGYILKEGKLKSILNDKKLNLLSIYTSNEIRDIDNDGILEFSIFTINPETEEQSAVGSDKITLWYKWNGIDGGILTRVDRDEPTIESNSEIFKEINSLIKTNESTAYRSLIENQSLLSYIDNTILLTNYIKELEKTMASKTIEIQRLFNSYQSGYLLNESATSSGRLSIDRLNELEYLKREKTLENELELKNSLILNLELGYKLRSSEGKYYYAIDYLKLIQNLEDSISKEYRDYLNILSLDTNEPYLIGDNLMLSPDKLGDRINILENFLLTYPYSTYILEIENIYKSYSKYFIFGDSNSPNFDPDSNKIQQGVLDNWNLYIEKYPYSYISDILNGLTLDIKNNQNIISPETKEKYNHIYK